MEGERERVEIKRICLNRSSREVLLVFCPVSEVESWEFLAFSVCFRLCLL